MDLVGNFVGNTRFPYLFREKRRVVNLSMDELGGERGIVPFVTVQDDGDYLIGAEVYESNAPSPVKIGGVFSAEGVSNLFVAYRAMQLLCYVDVIHNKTLGAACVAANREMYKMLIEFTQFPSYRPEPEEAAVLAFVKRVGKENLEQIMLMVPEPLEEVLTLLRENAIPLDTETITQEIRHGTITLTPFLRELGVETPEEYDARFQRRAEYVDKYTEYLTPYFQEMGIERGSTFSSAVLFLTIIALRKGIEEPDLVLAFSLITAHQAIYQKSQGQLVSLLPSGLRLGNSNLSQLINHAVEEESSNDIGRVVKFLKSSFTNSRTEQDYLKEVQRLQRDFKTMPDKIRL